MPSRSALLAPNAKLRGCFTSAPPTPGRASSPARGAHDAARRRCRRPPTGSNFCTQPAHSKACAPRRLCSSALVFSALVYLGAGAPRRRCTWAVVHLRLVGPVGVCWVGLARRGGGQWLATRAPK